MAGDAWWAELEDIVKLCEPPADPLDPLWFVVAVSKADADALLHCRVDCTVVLRDRRLFPLAPLMAHSPIVRGNELCKGKYVALWPRVCPLCASPELRRILDLINTRTRVAK